MNWNAQRCSYSNQKFLTNEINPQSAGEMRVARSKRSTTAESSPSRIVVRGKEARNVLAWYSSIKHFIALNNFTRPP